MDGEHLFSDPTRFKTLKGLVDSDLTDRSAWFKRAEQNRTARQPAHPVGRGVRTAEGVDRDRPAESGRFSENAQRRKFLLKLHDLTVGRALAVIDRSAYEHGITGGMSVMLGEIERLSCEGEPEMENSSVER